MFLLQILYLDALIFRVAHGQLRNLLITLLKKSQIRSKLTLFKWCHTALLNNYSQFNKWVEITYGFCVTRLTTCNMLILKEFFLREIYFNYQKKMTPIDTANLLTELSTKYSFLILQYRFRG